MLRLISLTLLIGWSVLVGAQAFGRFGYETKGNIPGFDVDESGFKVRSDAGDKIKFESASKLWKAVETSDTQQTIMLTGYGRSPQKIRTNLFATGFMLYFPNGFSLKIGNITRPYLSWDGGSAGPDVPTPASKWLILSFREKQPPLVISFLGRESGLILKGRAGDWSLESTEDFTGWVRISAPLGSEGLSTVTAASLGQLVKSVKTEQNFLAGPIPKLTRSEIAESLTNVVTTWEFDSTHVKLPYPLMLAPLGGYPIKLDQPLERATMVEDGHPVYFCSTGRVQVTFPTRRIPTGRAITIGEFSQEFIATASPIDLSSSYELALTNLLAKRERIVKQSAEDTVTQFLNTATYQVEPNTNQRLPYAKDGKGLDLCSVHSFLMQSTITPVRATSEPNSLLTSVTHRRDWETWLLSGTDSQTRRRAGALVAIAGALCPEPDRRMDGAMFQAGLAAERGLEVWKRRQGLITTESPLLEVAEDFRNSIFSMRATQPRADSFLSSLQSEVRIYGDLGIVAKRRDQQVICSWDVENKEPIQITLASGYPVTISGGSNLVVTSLTEALGFTVVRCEPTRPGSVELIIEIPIWAKALPQSVSPLTLTETIR